MKRVQRKGYYDKLPPNTKLVARPNKKYGNPFSLKEYTLEESLRLYREWLDKKLQENPDYLKPLKGFDLACYCKLDQKCHADIILKMLLFKRYYGIVRTKRSFKWHYVTQPDYIPNSVCGKSFPYNVQDFTSSTSKVEECCRGKEDKAFYYDDEIYEEDEDH